MASEMTTFGDECLARFQVEGVGVTGGRPPDGLQVMTELAGAQCSEKH
jgi:hypothetical protein